MHNVHGGDLAVLCGARVNSVIMFVFLPVCGLWLLANGCGQLRHIAR